MHYETPTSVPNSNSNEREEFMSRLVTLPASSTGTVGFVSLRTLELLSRFREECGGSCYLVSGARTSTLVQRAPSFRHKGKYVIDGYSPESGGR